MANVLEYVGKYRVLPELTDKGVVPKGATGGVDEDFVDYYIPCKGDCKILSCDYPSRLTFYSQSPIIIERILRGIYEKRISKNSPAMFATLIRHLEKKKIVLNITMLDGEGMFDFHVNDLPILGVLVKPMTKGKNIKPLSKKILTFPILYGRISHSQKEVIMNNLRKAYVSLETSELIAPDEQFDYMMETLEHDEYQAIKLCEIYADGGWEVEQWGYFGLVQMLAKEIIDEEHLMETFYSGSYIWVYVDEYLNLYNDDGTRMEV